MIRWKNEPLKQKKSKEKKRANGVESWSGSQDKRSCITISTCWQHFISDQRDKHRPVSSAVHYSLPPAAVAITLLFSPDTQTRARDPVVFTCDCDLCVCVLCYLRPHESTLACSCCCLISR